MGRQLLQSGETVLPTTSAQAALVTERCTDNVTDAPTTAETRSQDVEVAPVGKVTSPLIQSTMPCKLQPRRLLPNVQAVQLSVTRGASGATFGYKVNLASPRD